MAQKPETIEPHYIKTYILEMLSGYRQPSAGELIEEVENNFGWQARWLTPDIIKDLLECSSITRSQREYLRILIEDNSLIQALSGQREDTKVIKSTLDILLEEGQKFRKSDAFKEMIEFMAKFRRYSPYNNMLVRIQNPHCSFYATQADWYSRFERTLKEDAKPMLILAPMHPVMLVYGLDETEGKALPQKLADFAQFEGDWNPRWLSRLIDNANKYMIRVDFREHSSTSAGFATIVRGSNADKMRISIHDKLDEPSRFGVLCHELAHIFLGHLGSDKDHWWPSRLHLNKSSLEIEAEAVAFIVTQRFGLKGNSDAYLSGYIGGEFMPSGVSIDCIAKAAGKVEEMASGYVAKPKRK